MKPTFLPLALAVMIAAGMCGCDNPTATKTPDAPKSSINVGADVVTIRGCEYIKAMQYGGYVYTHLGNCTNHAPVVVTVTQECKYCTWARERAGPWPTNHLRTPFTLELQDATGGAHRISFPSNWFNTPVTLLHSRVTNAVEK